jgi:hypothetical protein
LTFHAPGEAAIARVRFQPPGKLKPVIAAPTEADIKEMSAKLTEKGNWFRGMQAVVSESWSGGRSLTFRTTR